MGDRIAVLKRGELQQCADPRTLYSRPANTFVAGFIGTPPINLFEARVTDDGGALELAGARLAMGEAQRSAAAGHRGATVQVGVRPEDLRLGAEGLAGVVELVEPLGSETLVHGSSAAGVWVSRVTSGAVPRVGERVSLAARPDALLLFDPASQRALLDAEVPATSN
jgi:multiple sugar transport system ATP-binding protein